MQDRLKRSLGFAAACALVLPGSWAQGSEDRSRNRIAREVAHEPITLPYYGVFDNLAFRVKGAAVTLLGRVNRPTLKSDAEKAVKQIEGVQRVDDPIKAPSLSPPDGRMRLEVYAATYGQPVLSQYALRAAPLVHIIAKNGNVTLEGTVANQMGKASFFTYASGVPGVISVTDRLQIVP